MADVLALDLRLIFKEIKLFFLCESQVYQRNVTQCFFNGQYITRNKWKKTIPFGSLQSDQVLRFRFQDSKLDWSMVPLYQEAVSPFLYPKESWQLKNK
jgi:hypothetical protein